jgi:hypothetical protein
MNDRKMIYLDDAIDAIVKRLGIKNESFLTEQEKTVVQVLRDMPSAQPYHDNLHPKKDPNFSSCSHCVHDEDSEEICVLRKCVHAVSELKECYTERRGNERTVYHQDKQAYGCQHQREAAEDFSNADRGRASCIIAYGL